MILYAIVSEVSIGALFLAGIVPGLLLALIFSIYCMVSAVGTETPDWGGWTNAAVAFRRSFFA